VSDATLKEVREFFDTLARPMALKDFRAEWQNGGLTDQDKAELRAGIGNGSLTY
jgi:hypothetical protein